jgi:hypothetical protein
MPLGSELVIRHQVCGAIPHNLPSILPHHTMLPAAGSHSRSMRTRASHHERCRCRPRRAHMGAREVLLAPMPYAQGRWQGHALGSRSHVLQRKSAEHVWDNSAQQVHQLLATRVLAQVGECHLHLATISEAYSKSAEGSVPPGASVCVTDRAPLQDSTASLGWSEHHRHTP